MGSGQVDPKGVQSQAVVARLEPLGMRRELLQYRLTELESQMMEAVRTTPTATPSLA